MALSLLKLVSTTTVTENYYNYNASSALTISDGAPVVLTVTAATWFNSSGVGVDALTTASSGGYYNLEINGVLQQPGFYTITSATVTLAVSAGSTATYAIPQSTPFTLEVQNVSTSS